MLLVRVLVAEHNYIPPDASSKFDYQIIMNRKVNINGKILLIVLSLAGIAVMGYLVSLHYSPEEGAFCNLGEGLSCDIVNQSTYAKVLGIPMSILGLVYFLGIFGASIWSYNKASLKIITFLSIVFLGPSLYLTGIEIFVLGNICVFCEVSKVLIVSIIIVSLFGLRPEKFSLKNFAAATVLAVLLGGAVYFIQRDSKPVEMNGKYDEFAQCLYDKGMRVYGSITCSFCAKQRQTFGNSFQYVREIECDPRNPNHEAERCITKNISKTPTWILEDESGNDLFRFDPGVISFEKLGEVSGCSFPDNS